MTKTSLLSILIFAGAGATAVACSSSSSDDTASGGSGGSGGSAGAHTGGSGGTHSGGSAGATHVGGTAGTGGAAGGTAEGGAGGEAGATPIIVTTLYQRLGEHTGIAKAVHQIVIKETQDPIIATYFSQQASATHKPTVADIEECFTSFLGAAAAGPGELYPITTSSGYKCRSMTAAHATLGIGAGTFDTFAGIASAELTTLGVLPDDVTAVTAVLAGTKAAIVDPNAASAARACQSPATCALPVPSEGGAGGETGVAGAAGATQ